MVTFKPPYIAGSVRIASISSGQEKVIDDSILSIDVSYSMDMSSELSMRIIDPSFLMASANYFQVGREVIYDIKAVVSFDSASPHIDRVSQVFEIAQVSLTNGPGHSPVFDIKCYPKAIQQMKRDKKPGTIKGTGSAYVQNAARKYGLKYVGEKTTKKQSITKASGDRQADSVWDVITRLASDAKFVVFEADGYLIFGSQKWLMHKWGIDTDSVRVRKDGKKNAPFVTKVRKWIPIQFPEIVKGRPGVIETLEYPNITISDNDPFSASDGSAVVERTNGVALRPGMTAWVGPCPNLEGFFLINNVSFSDRTPDPVSVSFLTPEKEPKEIKQLPVGKKTPQIISNSLPVTNIFSSSNTVLTSKVSGADSTIQPDARIFPLPDASNRTNRYPRMKTANLSKTVPEFSKSSFEIDKLRTTGNIDIWERPVLQTAEGPKTTYSITMEPFETGGEWRAYLITPIWNNGSGGVSELSESAAIAKFESDGKFLALVAGTTKKNCILNARDYGKLISMQQVAILKNRFPQYSRISDIPTTQGVE
jgi:hypothetical protein